jgi:hypothetical protein
VGTLRPIGDPQPVELIFKVTVSEEFVKDCIDKEGMEPARKWALQFDLAEVDTAALRQRLRRAWERYLEVEPYPEFPRPEGDPEAFLQVIEPWLDEVEEEEVEAEKAAAREAKEEKARTDAFGLELERWVSAHGSRRLQMAAERGYRTNTSYALERVGREMPGFWLDSAEDCEWGERADPSEEALNIEQAIQAHLNEVDPELEVRIVWLTETPRSLDRMMEKEDLEFSPQEALIVSGYLGRYLIVMPVDVRLRRTNGAA